MEGTKLLLGYLVSPFVLRAKIAFGLKGVDYEYREEVFGNKSELLLKSNPVYNKVPVLIHNGKPICESLIIVQYIDEVTATKGPSILPSQPYERAMARFWATFIDDKWFPYLLGFFQANTKEARAAAVEQLIAGLQVLEESYAKSNKEGKCFFSGSDSIGYIDIALGCYLGWIRAAEEMGNLKILDEEKTPHLARWSEKFQADAVVKEVFPGTEKFVEFGRMLQAMWNVEISN